MCNDSLQRASRTPAAEVRRDGSPWTRCTPLSGQGTNPEQLFAAGYAACFASALGLVGRQARVDTSEVSVTAEVSIGKDGAGFGLAVVIRVELPDALEGESGLLLVKQAHEVCPYSRATRGNIEVELVVE
ncbi:Ohr family peroxiredoxin [Kitasatospora sp. Root107]|uniref:Ohr family peroxiredoxin n=1 Tax=Kitasatospora sp. Root107 TaxID=1736424 RepID=UPI0009E70D84|nr:Ohr family peroxiredoxin [Kitasatospora sp. Root107]